MNTAQYLAAVKAKRNITSDYALAKALKISKQAASGYANGKNIPGPVVAFRVAEILGEQPAAVVAQFEKERAERAGKPEESEEWTDWMGKLASILLVAAVGGIPNADARLAQPSKVTDVYIVSNKKKRRWFDGLTGFTGLQPA